MMKNMKRMSLIAMVIALLVSAVTPVYAEDAAEPEIVAEVVSAAPVEIGRPVVQPVEAPEEIEEIVTGTAAQPFDEIDEFVSAGGVQIPVEKEEAAEDMVVTVTPKPAPKATRKPVVEEVEEEIVEPTEVEPTEEPAAFEVSIQIVTTKEMYFVGDIIRIESTITGECANPAYQWQVMHAGSQEWVDIEGATNSYYEFAIDTVNYADTYRVNVTDVEIEVPAE